MERPYPPELAEGSYLIILPNQQGSTTHSLLALAKAIKQEGGEVALISEENITSSVKAVRQLFPV